VSRLTFKGDSSRGPEDASPRVVFGLLGRGPSIVAFLQGGRQRRRVVPVKTLALWLLVVVLVVALAIALALK